MLDIILSGTLFDYYFNIFSYLVLFHSENIFFKNRKF